MAGPFSGVLVDLCNDFYNVPHNERSCARAEKKQEGGRREDLWQKEMEKMWGLLEVLAELDASGVGTCHFRFRSIFFRSYLLQRSALPSAFSCRLVVTMTITVIRCISYFFVWNLIYRESQSRARGSEGQNLKKIEKKKFHLFFFSLVHRLWDIHEVFWLTIWSPNTRAENHELLCSSLLRLKKKKK